LRASRYEEGEAEQRAIDHEEWQPGKAVAQQISDLVDMAKAEALDAMGEDRAALELADRYLDV